MCHFVPVCHLYKEAMHRVVVAQRDVTIQRILTDQMTGLAFLAHKHLLSAQCSTFQISLHSPFCLHVRIGQRMVEVQFILADIKCQLTFPCIPIL